MTINYTTNLSLAEPVTGTESGTWGDDVNKGLTDYLDISIAGTLALTSASFTSNALTLANTTGSSSSNGITATTAQYYVLKISSLAANVTITAPTASKSYIVVNNDPTYTVTIKASGQTGVTVAVSSRALVVFNGTDYAQVGASAGGSTTQIQYNNAGALAGSSTFTFNSGTNTVTISTLNLTNALTSGYGGTGLTTFTAANNAIYSTSSSALTAGTLPAAAGGTGLTSFTSGGAVYATSTSALTTGTLPVASGGTALSTTPTNGQLLIGNGTNYTLATITAGTGITVTNASGSITIASSGGGGSSSGANMYLAVNFGGF